MNRRTFLTQLAAATLAGAMPPAVQPTLKAAGSAKGILVGSSVSRRELAQPAFESLLSSQTAIVVCENDMKWGPIHPKPAGYDFSGGDLLMHFAADHSKLMRGHNLCWHQQLPDWFSAVVTSDNAEDILRLHIATVAGHYKGRLHSWDVVNEAIHTEDGQPGGLRNSPWYQMLGPRYIEIAFRAAADADPHAILTYNDYDLEQSGADFQAKRTAVLSLLRSLRDRNVPLQAIGLQSHLRARTHPENWEPLHDFLRQIEQLDLQIFITELDVNDKDLPSDTAQRDAAVAALYSDYLTHVLQHKSVRAVLTWGLTNADSWLTNFTPRDDKLPQRPLPFDDRLQPTRVYQAMLEAIQKAPER